MKISEIEYHIHSEVNREINDYHQKSERPISIEEFRIHGINLTNGILIRKIAELTERLNRLEYTIAENEHSRRFDGDLNSK